MDLEGPGPVLTMKFHIPGFFLKKRILYWWEAYDYATHRSCVCPGDGTKVVCNGYTHTCTSNDLAHLSSLCSGGTVLRKEKGVLICLVSSVSLPIPPAQVQTDRKHQSCLCVEGEHSDMGLT